VTHINRNRVAAFYRRWNIPVDDGEEFKRFKNRLLFAIDLTVGQFIVDRRTVSNEFALLLGRRQPSYSASGMLAALKMTSRPVLGEAFTQTSLWVALDSSENEKDLAFSLQCLFWVLAEHRCPNLGDAFHAVQMAVGASPLCGVRLAKRGDHVTVYPLGARLLDDAAVNDSLAWLEGHPGAAKHFENALRICLRKETAQYRNLLDELRCSLENLVRRLLGNRRSLENQKQPLLQWLEKKGTHFQVRNLYQTLLAYFTQYQNDAVKHGEAWAESEVEYMIYLTGTFMRFLLQVNGAGQT